MSTDLVLPGRVSTTALSLPDDLSYEDWERVGETLGRIGRAHQWWLGDWLNFGEAAYGEKYTQAINETGYEYGPLRNIAWTSSSVEVSRRRDTLSFSHHAEVAPLTPREQSGWLDKAEKFGWSVAELRKQIKTPPLLEAPDVPVGEYSCIVIDPPWPMEKIERDVRPNQAAPLDYRPMSLEELAALSLPAADDCHLYLWTTHKFLPAALELAETWGFNYQCLLTWVKNVGFTPYSFMYSTELVVFARRGSLDLLVKGRRLDFTARVREHSRKPDEFYELVRDVSPSPRIDMFSREARDGFDQWGNETARFADAA
jgi:N6-adenosine-specific RNA methylase IME4